MTEIVTLLESFAPYLKATPLRQMARVISAILTMSGRVTMLGISRWAEKGGSYRTIQRFYNTVLPWAILHWAFFLVLTDSVVESRTHRRSRNQQVV